MAYLDGAHNLLSKPQEDSNSIPRWYPQPLKQTPGGTRIAYLDGTHNLVSKTGSVMSLSVPQEGLEPPT